MIVRTRLVCMKNITLSADEKLIEQVRLVASERQTTLNQMFRDWLATVAPDPERRRAYREFMQATCPMVRVGGRRFTREEMNDR